MLLLALPGEFLRAIWSMKRNDAPIATSQRAAVKAGQTVLHLKVPAPRASYYKIYGWERPSEFWRGCHPIERRVADAIIIDVYDPDPQSPVYLPRSIDDSPVHLEHYSVLGEFSVAENDYSPIVRIQMVGLPQSKRAVVFGLSGSPAQEKGWYLDRHFMRKIDTIWMIGDWALISLAILTIVTNAVVRP